MHILTILGPNMNLLGWMTRSTGQRLTLDKLEKALRRSAKEAKVEVTILQIDDEARACKNISQRRSKCDAVLIVPGVWDSTGYQLKETVQIIGKPLGLYNLAPEGGPWNKGDPSILSEIAATQGDGSDEVGLAEQLKRLVDHLRG